VDGREFTNLRRSFNLKLKREEKMDPNKYFFDDDFEPETFEDDGGLPEDDFPFEEED
jgi:hypothetical protein